MEKIMETILSLINTYGLETVIIALLINVFTGIIKMPIKKLASKAKDSTKITRFIVFLPIILGFGFTFLYVRFFDGGFDFNRAFVTLWITSSSLSLTIYAILEKIFPSKKKLLTACEVKTSESILTEIKKWTEEYFQAKDTASEGQAINEVNSETQETGEMVAKKIILRGKKG